PRGREKLNDLASRFPETRYGAFARTALQRIEGDLTAGQPGLLSNAEAELDDRTVGVSKPRAASSTSVPEPEPFSWQSFPTIAIAALMLCLVAFFWWK